MIINYKEFLESLIDNKKKDSIVKDFNDNSTDTTVNFTIEFKPGTLKELLDKKIEHNINGLQKFLKLYSIQSTCNMHLFNNKEQLKKYYNPEEIIDDYYDTRLQYYGIRKEFLLNKLNSDLKLISNKTRFINDNLNSKIDLRKKKKDEIITLLNKMKFDDIYNNDYEYLRKMPMDSVSEESIEKMKKEKNEITSSIIDLESSSNQEIWLKELLILKEEYVKIYNNEKSKEISTIKVKKNKK
jgi:DNA topoisomerase-2